MAYSPARSGHRKSALNALEQTARHFKAIIIKERLAALRFAGYLRSRVCCPAPNTATDAVTFAVIIVVVLSRSSGARLSLMKSISLAIRIELS